MLLKEYKFLKKSLYVVAEVLIQKFRLNISK